MAGAPACNAPASDPVSAPTPENAADSAVLMPTVCAAEGDQRVIANSHVEPDLHPITWFHALGVEIQPAEYLHASVGAGAQANRTAMARYFFASRVSSPPGGHFASKTWIEYGAHLLLFRCLHFDTLTQSGPDASQIADGDWTGDAVRGWV